MQDYLKSTLRVNTDRIISHVGTNDLTSYKHPEQIAESIIDVANS